VDVLEQGRVIIRHSDKFQVFRDQCCNDHMTTQLCNMHIKTIELLKAFLKAFGDVKNHAGIALTRRTYSSQLKQQIDSGQNTPDLLIKPFNKS